MTRRHAAALAGSALLVFGLVAIGVVVALRVSPVPQAAVIGVVLTDDADPMKQTPISGVNIAGTIGSKVVKTHSDPSGFFRLTVPISTRLGRFLKLNFARVGYKAAEVSIVPSDALFVQRLEPIVKRTNAQHTIGNVRIRYTVKTGSFIDVGPVVKAFEVRNTGNVPCHGGLTCSPNGQWKAAKNELRLDAHEGNRFRNPPSVSCIAGPCPFTRIETEDLREDDRIFVVSALNWSDTATFLVEADVVHNQISDMVRETIPVEFGRSLTFSLPPNAGGPSIQAELDGQPLVFPLGPDLVLSWADCSVKVDADKSQSYSCELVPQYRFL